MKSKRWVNGFVLGVLALDVLFVMILAVDGGSTVRAQPVNETLPSADDQAIPSTETLLQLGRELAGRSAELERREAELEERLRGAEVLRRAGLLDEGTAGDAAGDEPETAGRQTDPRSATAFQTLQKAYENMEPDSAASALAALAKRDNKVVVELLLGWSPRTSGAILDSLTRSDPALAADLSYEIWKLSSGGAE